MLSTYLNNNLRIFLQKSSRSNTVPKHDLIQCCSCGIGPAGPPGFPGETGVHTFSASTCNTYKRHILLMWYFVSGQPGRDGIPGQHGSNGVDAKQPTLADIDWCYECPEAPAGPPGSSIVKIVTSL